MAFHKSLTGTDIHVAYAFTYADAATRRTGAGLVAADVGKLAIQSDNMSVWVLVDESPVVWKRVSGPVQVFSYSASHSIVDLEEEYLDMDATGGGINATLPAASSTNKGFVLTVQKSDSSANAVTVVGTVNGISNPTLDNQYDSLTVISTGAAWRAI